VTLYVAPADAVACPAIDHQEHKYDKSMTQNHDVTGTTKG
jgi:hypothetical protein